MPRAEYGFEAADGVLNAAGMFLGYSRRQTFYSVPSPLVCCYTWRFWQIACQFLRETAAIRGWLVDQMSLRRAVPRLLACRAGK